MAAAQEASRLAGSGELAVVQGRNGEAAGLLERAIALDSSQARYYYALGCAKQGLGDAEGAITAYRLALARDPANAGAHTNLASLLQERGERGSEPELDEAVAHLRQARDLVPQAASGWLNLGYALDRQRKLGEALECYARAIGLDPALPEAHFNRSLALLALGDFDEGWKEYEWRWPASGFPRPALARPEWNGAPLDGGTLLVYTEQGFGDAIQFARYLRLARARVGRVVLRSTPELRRLFAALPDVDLSLVDGEPLPEFAAHCSLLSLPRILATGASIPSDFPYVTSTPELQAKWRAIVPPETSLKVGIAWASQPMARIAPLKSLDFGMLAPLFGIHNVSFYSLQKGGAANRNSSLRDLAPLLSDFADTAAALEQLDLTISVDTSVAHLAGAMGRPVWTLLPYVPDWRWQPDAEASAWYPTMRLYKQSRRGDWSDVVGRVAADLEVLSRT